MQHFYFAVIFYYNCALQGDSRTLHLTNYENNIDIIQDILPR